MYLNWSPQVAFCSSLIHQKEQIRWFKLRSDYSWQLKFYLHHAYWLALQFLLWIRLVVTFWTHSSFPPIFPGRQMCISKIAKNAVNYVFLLLSSKMLVDCILHTLSPRQSECCSSLIPWSRSSTTFWMPVLPSVPSHLLNIWNAVIDLPAPTVTCLRLFWFPPCVTIEAMTAAEAWKICYNLLAQLICS